MIISVLGATGGSGQHFVRQALAAGHSVRALVRSPDKLDPSFQSHENFSAVSDVDIFSADNLEKGFDGADAVVSCLGCRPTLMPWGQEITLYSESIKAIVEAMRRRNVGRIVAMTSMFTDDHPSYGFFVRWILKPLFIGRNLDDMARMENHLEEQCQDVNFTVVRPPGLGKEGPTSKEIKENVGGQTVPGMTPGNPTQRGDVARFLLKALTCNTYDRKMVAIATFGPDSVQ